MSSDIKRFLLLPHIKIHNANALSSPYTIGFPAMTAWLGAVHALQRKLNAKSFEVLFSGVAVTSHQVDLHTYRGADDFVSSIIGTANPLDKTGARSAFIEEARCHLQVSLLIEIIDFNIDVKEEFLEQVDFLLNAQMKIAGGDIQTFNPPEILVVEHGNEKDKAKVIRKLMPGYTLIERRELMLEGMKHGKDGIDALLDYLAIHHHCEQSDKHKVLWHSKRKTFDDQSIGWVVPIATGFQGVSNIAEAKNQRDPEKPHRFAESIVTLGEFKMPYRFDSIEDMLWRYHYDQENGLYLCQQQKHASPTQNSISNEFD
jgi:CRISPR-associated protein Csy2